jgi:hypothetical protein
LDVIFFENGTELNCRPGLKDLLCGGLDFVFYDALRKENVILFDLYWHPELMQLERSLACDTCLLVSVGKLMVRRWYVNAVFHG